VFAVERDEAGDHPGLGPVFVAPLTPFNLIREVRACATPCGPPNESRGAGAAVDHRSIRGTRGHALPRAP